MEIPADSLWSPDWKERFSERAPWRSARMLGYASTVSASTCLINKNS